MNFKMLTYKVVVLVFLFCFVFFSLALPYYYVFAVWIYLIFSNLFLWFNMILLCKADVKKEVLVVNDYKCSVVIPFRNEGEREFLKCLTSAVLADGVDEVLVGNDGSSVDTLKNIRKMKIFRGVKFFDFEHRGKIKTQVDLVKHTRNEFVIQMDSDVIVEKDAIRRMISRFSDSKVGLVNAQVLMVDNDNRLLSKVQRALYKCASQIGRKSYGLVGCMPSSSGALLAFRKSVYMSLLDSYLNPRFMGVSLGFGEDRLLTMEHHRLGYKVVYSESSVAHTYPQNGIFRYLKQQVRWIRSNIWGSLMYIPTALKKKDAVYSIILIGNFVLPIIYSLITMILFVNALAYGEYVLFIVFLSSIMLTSFVKNFVLLSDKSLRTFDMVCFSIFNAIFITPMWVYGMLTIDNNGWGTR